ncbi:MAG: ADP-glyceromanno-heptose 6-epimerase [Bacteroidetes bacterium]|nr:ADP-glyceromanno-heptose 6-epimerase [Bacteroidota bacterium]MBM3424621.1 ADP-glyceromanno-heptose 6-epimerase [Bacteroidota bacterium]
MARVVITGAAGFIGSCLVHYFSNQHHHEVIEVDDFQRPEKNLNFEPFTPYRRIQRKDFIDWFRREADSVDFVIHMGARTNTTEQNLHLLNELNVFFSQELWNLCTQHAVPMIYASSAATYGNGALGYSDDHQRVFSLVPMNPYGQSKQDFDIWVLKQQKSPPFWAGLKFFNVYGPNEYHKGRMASVVFQAYHQIKKNGSIQLFRSHRPDIADGYQSRDFIYIKDIVKVIEFLFEQKPESAIYNLGSGVANPFYALATATFDALRLPHNIAFIDTPEDIRSNYQYYTCAEMGKLRKTGYLTPFHTLQEGVFDYVQQYLSKDSYL